MTKKLIGLSVGTCVQDICEGRIKLADVAGIVSGTREFDGLANLIETYKRTLWRDYPKEAEHAMASLLKENLILQPLIDRSIPGYQGEPHTTEQGHWLDLEKGELLTLKSGRLESAGPPERNYKLGLILKAARGEMEASLRDRLNLQESPSALEKK